MTSVCSLNLLKSSEAADVGHFVNTWFVGTIHYCERRALLPAVTHAQLGANVWLVLQSSGLSPLGVTAGPAWACC